MGLMRRRTREAEKAAKKTKVPASTTKATNDPTACKRRKHASRSTSRQKGSSNDELQGSEHSAMRRLPNELWSLVASNLDPLSAAVLKTSCKFMYHAIDRQFWDALDEDENRGERLLFLIRMDRLFPDHVLCSSCLFFHPRGGLATNWKSEPTYQSFRTRLRCREETLVARMQDTFDIPWRLVQLVLRAHYVSPEYGLSEGVLHHKSRSSTCHQVSTPRIVDNRLLLKIESLMPVETSARSTSMEDFKAFASIPRCQHLQNISSIETACHCGLSKIPPRYSRRHSYRYSSELYRCPNCPSEYMVTIRPASTYGPAINEGFRWDGSGHYILAATCWLDLGEGRKPGRGFEKLAARLAWSLYNRNGPPYYLGGRPTIRSRYESREGKELPDETVVPVEFD